MRTLSQLLVATMLLLGCATSTTSASSQPAHAAAAVEPEPKLCIDSNGCTSGGTCVKALDTAQGACSQVSAAPACRASKDCAAGFFCFRPAGFNGVCFKP